ncbi:hypothetical protein D1825_14935 [Cellulomonas rhizosphaerae]|uniref:Glucanase n=1 Tax=Cellulomonas rhizosphaerae TaxID=2293719 RepID=A0A413RIK8_9CELL|nr:hypothetical protein D1825_14935 [Cellulomonas rhizosphaerae]
MSPHAPTIANVNPRRLAALLLAAAFVLVVGAPAQAATVDPRLTQKLYVEPAGSAYAAAKAARKAGKVATAKKLEVISKTAQGKWIGDWAGAKQTRADVRAYVKAAAKAKRTPLVVVYAVPGRDCGGQSAGGLAAGSYKTWIKGVAAGLKDGAVKGRSRALVALEPDSLMMDCAGSSRSALITYAAKTLAATGAWVYLDAGHSNWRTPADTATRLKAAGVRYARGFFTNVSNFNATSAEKRYATKVGASLKAKGITAAHRHYVIDTSRNGRATANGQWCNPPKQGLGAKPSLSTSKGALDGYLWVKRPGESDGACNGGPGAGQWWQAYALDLVKYRKG